MIFFIPFNCSYNTPPRTIDFGNISLGSRGVLQLQLNCTDLLHLISLPFNFPGLKICWTKKHFFSKNLQNQINDRKLKKKIFPLISLPCTFFFEGGEIKCNRTVCILHAEQPKYVNFAFWPMYSFLRFLSFIEFLQITKYAQKKNLK